MGPPHPRSRRLAPFREGHTLLEMVLVLLLLGLTLGEGLPAARSQLDRLAVLGARESLAGLLSETRAQALAHGGARLLLKVRPPTGEILVGGEVVSRLELGEEYGVSLHLSRDRLQAELAFDALGLGRVASQTLTVRKGGARALLLVSSYGRVTRP